MIRDFSKEDLAPAASNDAELTIGGFALFAIGGFVLFLCTACFGAGYFMGHRSASDRGSALVLPVSDATAPAVASGSALKPGAGQSAAQTPSPASLVTQTSDVASPSGDSEVAVTSASSGSSQPAAKPAAESTVRPALQGHSAIGETASAFQVQPALKQVQGWMVQIAAVSHSEDAEVLVNALRKRGYNATARRDAADILIHVQTGPFVNRNDANAMRQKLLSDGYNAIVQ